MTRRPCLIVLLVVVATTLGVVDASAQPQPTVWDGVYTAEQAMRGQTAYTLSCASCHAEDLRGDSNSPSIVGVSFTFLWGDMSLAALFTKIQTQMPTDRPNSLAAQTYLDIVAYILEANKFPPGDEELGTDPATMSEISITATPPES